MEFDHQQAVSSHAVERYLLGELPSPLREAFEDHYFCCPQCAEALRVGTIFRENVRALLQTEPHTAATPALVVSEAGADHSAPQNPGISEEKPLGWRSWFRVPALVPWVAAVALLLFVVVRERDGRTSASGAVESASLLNLRSDARGPADTAIPAVRAKAMLSIGVDVPSDGAFEWTLKRAGTAKDAFAHHGSADAQNGVLALVVDTRILEPGEYVLAVRSAETSTLPDRLYSFVLRSR